MRSTQQREASTQVKRHEQDDHGIVWESASRRCSPLPHLAPAACLLQALGCQMSRERDQRVTDVEAV
jgi:hypothetical protein